MVHNPVARARSSVVRVPFYAPSTHTVTVSRGGGVNVEAEVTPATSYSTPQLAALLPGELYHQSVSHCSVLYALHRFSDVSASCSDGLKHSV